MQQKLISDTIWQLRKYNLCFWIVSFAVFATDDPDTTVSMVSVLGIGKCGILCGEQKWVASVGIVNIGFYGKLFDLSN